MLVTIIDYGIGNLQSVGAAFRKTGAEVRVSADPGDALAADKLVLPGVGSFAAGMEHLRSRGLVDALQRRVMTDRTPILGICLGLQLFTRRSEEGDAAGLGWLAAETRRFPFSQTNDPKVPHLGWNEVRFDAKHPLLEGVPPHACFYFAHSYTVCCDRPEDVLGSTRYGLDFASAVHSGNLYGIQFHPEKSHGAGQRLIENFVRHG